MKKGPVDEPLSPENYLRLWHDVDINARTNPKLYANWIHDAVRVTSEVANGNTDLVPVFRIRLYGVLADIFSKLTESQRNIAELNRPPYPAAEEMIEAIKTLAARFTRDELIYIQYLRNTECHPVQDAYRIRVARDGTLKDWVDHHLIPAGPPVTVEETNAAVSRVLGLFGVDEHAVARHLAAKAVEPMRAVQHKSYAWCGSPL
jgi:hypothetical protein